MITRSKSLLVIVGNYDTLIADENWKQLIDYCEDNGAIVRKGRKLHDRIKF